MNVLNFDYLGQTPDLLPLCVEHPYSMLAHTGAIPTPSEVTGICTGVPTPSAVASDSSVSRAVSNHSLPFIGLV